MNFLLDSQQTGAQGKKRSKACTNCRKLKVKCIKIDGDKECSRCKSQALQCVYEYKVSGFKAASGVTIEPQSGISDKLYGKSGISSNIVPIQPRLPKLGVHHSPVSSDLASTSASSMPIQQQIRRTQNSRNNLQMPSSYPVPGSGPTTNLNFNSTSYGYNSNEMSSKELGITRISNTASKDEDRWKSSVEGRLSDFDNKLGSILLLLERQNHASNGHTYQHQQYSYQEHHQQKVQKQEQEQYRNQHQYHQPAHYEQYQRQQNENMPLRQEQRQQKRIQNDIEEPYSKRPRTERKVSEESFSSTQSQPASASASASPSPSPTTELLSITSNIKLESILTIEEAKELFNFFNNKISPQLFGFDVSNYSVDDIWINCPLLIATISCISSIHYSIYNHLSQQLESFIYQSTKDILFKHPTNEIEAFNTIAAFCFCGFWFKKNQMFTGLAVQLAKTMNLISPKNKKSLISRKDRLKLWYLLYILDGQQSMAFNRSLIMDNKDETIVKSREILGKAENREQESINKVIDLEELEEDMEHDENSGTDDSRLNLVGNRKINTNYSNLRLVSQVEYHQALTTVFHNEAWDLLAPASFGLPFKTNLDLDKWMVQWTVLLSPFNNYPAWSSKSTLIYYNFAKMHINSTAVRNFKNDGELPSWTEIEQDEINSSENDVGNGKSKIYYNFESKSDSSNLNDRGSEDGSEDEEDDEDEDISKELSPFESKKVSSELALSAAETVLGIVLNDADILNVMKYVPIHIHIMLYYAAMLVLRPPAYLSPKVQDNESKKSEIESIKLVKRLRHAIAVNEPTDKEFSRKVTRALTELLNDKITDMKKCMSGVEITQFLKVIEMDDAKSFFEGMKRKSQKISAWPGVDAGHPSKMKE